MTTIISRRLASVLAVQMLTCLTHAQETALFDGKSLTGWTFQVSESEKVQAEIDDVWGVENDLLVTNNLCDGILNFEAEFENYELSLEWRSMLARKNGVTIGAFGSVFINTSPETGSFRRPKSVEISLRDVGDVYFRDVEPFSEREWAFPAPDFADDVDKDLGEWNHMRIICRGDRLTVIANGTPVNQVDKLTQTKGGVALNSQPGFFQAPTFFRNIKVRPLTEDSAKAESLATQRLAREREIERQKTAAYEKERMEAERQEQMKEAEFESRWAKIDVVADLEFSGDALSLPFPDDAVDFEFDSTFENIELKSRRPLAELSRFYRTEMARRGWKEKEKDRDDESVEVTFRHGDAEVELELDVDSGEVEISLGCDGLSFDGANDPSRLAALGIPQPKAYVYLQQTLTFPNDVYDLEYDGGERCLFKTGLKLQQAFDEFSRQIRAQGFRESRRPIISDNRRYTEFRSGRKKLSLNVFSHKDGARLVVTYDES